MKVQVLSDLHLEFETYDYVETDSDVVVLAGDIHVRDEGVVWAMENIKNKPVLYVLGNHEFYSRAYPMLVNSVKGMVKGSNINILENESVTIDGVNFYGCTLWTDFSLFGSPEPTGYICQHFMNDYRKIRVSPELSKLRATHTASIHRESLDWLKTQLAENLGEKNVVITHHAPSKQSLPEEKVNDVTSAAYVSTLEGMMNEYQPDYWIHGHIHRSSNYIEGSCNVISNPRGYPRARNPEFRDDFIIEV